MRWPNATTVDRAVRRWAGEMGHQHPEVVRAGYFGSYARGDWGVGSDVDLVMVVDRSERPFVTRAAQWDSTGLPVPADLLVYTLDEWEELGRRGRFGETLRREAVWVYERA